MTGGGGGGRQNRFPFEDADDCGVAAACAGGEEVDVNGDGKSPERDSCGAGDVCNGTPWLGNAEDWLEGAKIGPPKTDLGVVLNVWPPKTEVVDMKALPVDPRPTNADCTGAVAEVKGAKADLTWPFA